MAHRFPGGFFKQTMSAVANSDALRTAIAGYMEADLDLAFDAVSARNLRIVGNDRVRWHAVRTGIKLLNRILGGRGGARQHCRNCR